MKFLLIVIRNRLRGKKKITKIQRDMVSSFDKRKPNLDEATSDVDRDISKPLLQSITLKFNLSPEKRNPSKNKAYKTHNKM